MSLEDCRTCSIEKIAFVLYILALLLKLIRLSGFGSRCLGLSVKQGKNVKKKEVFAIAGFIESLQGCDGY